MDTIVSLIDGKIAFHSPWRERFAAAWDAILKENPHMRPEQHALHEVVTQAGEIELMKGTHPQYERIRTFSKLVMRLASERHPKWKEFELSCFSAFVFNLEH